MADVKTLSATKIGTLLHGCAHQFELRYLHGRYIGSVPMIRGAAVAKANEADLRHKLDTGELLTSEEVRDVARDAVHDDWQGRDSIRFQEDEKALGVKKVRGMTVDAAVKFAGLHHRRVAPHVRPRTVEGRFEFELPGLGMPIRGRYDLVTEDDEIEDAKTKTKSPAKDEAHNSFQLGLYDLAFVARLKRRPKGLRLRHLVVTPSGQEKVVTQETHRTDEERNTVIRRIFAAKEQIEKGVFPPIDPNDWRCSPKMCEFWKNGCKYVR